MKDDKIITQITLNKDEVLLKKKVYSDRPLFRPLFRSDDMRDATMMLLDMSTAEQYVMKMIIPKLDYTTNCVVINLRFNTAIDKNKFSLGYKRLKDKHILIRYVKEHYMVNPDFIIPMKYYEECKQKWSDYNEDR